MAIIVLIGLVECADRWTYANRCFSYPSPPAFQINLLALLAKQLLLAVDDSSLFFLTCAVRIAKNYVLALYLARNGCVNGRAR